MVGGKGNVHIHCFADGLAVVQRFHHREVFFVGVNDIRDLQKQVGAFNGVCFSPAFPCAGGSFDGGVNIFLGGFGAGGKALAIGGAEGVVSGAVRSVLPLTVDEEGIFVLQIWLFHDASFG